MENSGRESEAHSSGIDATHDAVIKTEPADVEPENTEQCLEPENGGISNAFLFELWYMKIKSSPPS